MNEREGCVHRQRQRGKIDKKLKSWLEEGEQVERSTRLSLKVLEELEFSGSLAAWIGPETWGREGLAKGGVSDCRGAQGQGREENIQRMGSLAPSLGLH